MRKFVFANVVFGTLGLAAFTTAPLTFAVAHEEPPPAKAHRPFPFLSRMECSRTGMDAINADIQPMRDGKAKTTAMKEMGMAEEMMAKKDMKSCATHMQNARIIMRMTH